MAEGAHACMLQVHAAVSGDPGMHVMQVLLFLVTQADWGPAHRNKTDAKPQPSVPLQQFKENVRALATSTPPG